MTHVSILETIKTSVVVCDGAMGTQLFQAGLAPGVCGEQWNIDRPGAIEAIHQRYVNAGCHCVTTNSFGGSALALSRHGLDAQAEALNRAAAQLARRAVGDDVWVLGDIGPFGGFLEPLGDVSRATVLETFTQQARALRDGGADAAIIETMTDLDELAVAIEAARSCGDWPIIATCAFDHGDGETYRTMMGATVADAVQHAIDAGANIVGANCGTAMSLDDYRRLAGQLLAAAGDVPVIMQANAGAPRVVDGHQVYGATAQDMAGLAKALVDAGVRMVGGCCGTTPDHLRAIAEQLVS